MSFQTKEPREIKVFASPLIIPVPSGDNQHQLPPIQPLPDPTFNSISKTSFHNAKNESKHTSFSGALSSTTLPNETPSLDISNQGSVIDEHGYRKAPLTASLISYDQMSSKLGLQLSQVTSNSARASLKKFQLFKDSMEESSVNDSNLESNSRSTTPPSIPLCTPLPPMHMDKVVPGLAKVPTMVNSKLDMRLDPSWLEGCPPRQKMSIRKPSSNTSEMSSFKHPSFSKPVGLYPSQPAIQPSFTKYIILSSKYAKFSPSLF
jgi:hypothetical protein